MKKRFVLFFAYLSKAFRALIEGDEPVNARPKGEVTGRIVTTVRHFNDSLLQQSGVCSWRDALEASKTWKGDRRIRVALRILQIMPHYVGRPDYKDKKQESQVLQALSYLAAPQFGGAQ